MVKEISFEQLLDDLSKLKNIKVNIDNDVKRSLQRKRSNVFGGSGWRSGGVR